MRGASAVVGLCLAIGVLAPAQQAQPSPQSPSMQPPPVPIQQQQIMGYFAGDWKLSGTSKLSPKSPAAPFTGTEHGEWVPGQFFLETHSVTHGPMGDVHGVRVMEYNPGDKVYTYNAYNSLGEHVMAKGTVNGDTWVWNAEEKMNGVIVPARYTVTFVSADSYKFRSEVQNPNGAWSTVTEGTATRTQGN